MSLILASGLGVGYIPPMPGTVGSLQGIILAYLTKGWWVGAKIILFLMLFLLGVLVSERVSRTLGIKDPDEVVIDEIAGAYLTVFVASNLWEFGVAFILFRAIDIQKPSPVKRLEGLRGGFGIMLDDILAGLLTALLVFFIISIKRLLG